MFVSFTVLVTIFKMALGFEQGVDWDVVGIQEVGVNDKENMCLRQEGLAKRKNIYKQE